MRPGFENQPPGGDVAPDLHRAAAQFFGPLVELAPLDDGNMLDGSAAAQVARQQGMWRLYRWPQAWPRSRVAFVHTVLTACHARGVTGVPWPAATPTGRTILELDGALYDAQSWPPGEPATAPLLAPVAEPGVFETFHPARLTSLTSFVAQVHTATEPLPQMPALQTSLGDHLSRLFRRDLPQAAWLGSVLRGRTSASEYSLGLELVDRLLLVGQRLASSPAIHGTETTTVSIVGHTNLAPAHTWFLGESCTGLSGFERCAFTSPVLDIAQLIVSFNGWQAAELVIEAYARVRYLSTFERQLIPVAAATVLAQIALRLLARVAQHPTPLPKDDAALLLRLVSSLQALHAVLPEVDTA